MATSQPSSITISDQVRQTCAALIAETNDAIPCLSEIENFASSYNAEALDNLKQQYERRLTSPIIFESDDQEVNFSFVHDMLQFGSGYRLELKKIAGRGASDTILFGMIGLHTSIGNLTVDALQGLSLQTISEYFGLPLNEEYEVQPGIRSYRPSPLKPLAMNIHGAIISSTAVLQTFQCKDFAQFVRKTGRRSIDTTGKPSAQYLLSQIVQYFEPFQDEATVAPTAAGTPTPASTTSSEVGEGSSTTTTSQLGTVQGPMPVKIYKKAQLCVANLHTRFSTKIPEACDYRDIHAITIFADNVVPAMMRHLGLLTLSPTLAKQIDASKPVSKRQAFVIRAAAVVTGELILDAINNRSTSSTQGKCGEGEGSNNVNDTKVETDTKTTDMDMSGDQSKQKETDESAEKGKASDVAAGSTTSDVSIDNKEENVSVSTANPEEKQKMTMLLDKMKISTSNNLNRDILHGGQLDFLFYTMGKSNAELRAIPRHYYKAGMLY